MIEEIVNAQAELESSITKSDVLQEKIVSKGKQEGESLADVRALQAIAASHLAGRRKDLIRVVSESLPFMIAGLPDDIEISRYVQENGFAPKWFKTSAKTGENVEETLSLIIR